MADRDRYSPPRPASLQSAEVPQPALDDETVIASFRQRRRIYYTVTALVAVVVFAAILTPIRSGVNPAYIVFPMVAISIVTALTYWRCPACNKLLGKGYRMKFCQNCGARLT